MLPRRRVAWVIFVWAGHVGLDSGPVAAQAPEPPRVISARVLTEAGDPLPDARIVVNRYVEADRTHGPRRDLRSTEHRSDAAGRYSFDLTAEELAEPRLAIATRTSHAGFVPARGWYGEIRAGFAEEAWGDRRSFESKLSPGVSVAGTVVGPDGRPVAGAAVRAHSSYVPTGSGPDSPMGLLTDGTTDEAGRFEVMVRSPCKLSLFLASPDHALRALKIPDERRGDLGRFELADGRAITGRIADDAGRPLGGVPVRAYQVGPKRVDSGPPDHPGSTDAIVADFERAGLSGPDGQFRIPPLPPGIYEVEPREFATDLALGCQTGPLPLPFRARKVTLVADREPPPLDFRPEPHVAVAVRFADGRGRPV